LLAESKGFRLDDTGLFPATHGSGGKRVMSLYEFVVLSLVYMVHLALACVVQLQGTRASASLKFNTEKEVFDFLGFPWLEPHERNL